MLVHVGVALALLGTERTSLRARLQGRDDYLFVAAGPAGADSARRQADVGAIEVEPDALPEFRSHPLCQASVGAGRAALGTAVAFLDAANERIVRVAADVGVSGNHLSHVVHRRASKSESWCPPLTEPYARAGDFPWGLIRHQDGPPRR